MSEYFPTGSAHWAYTEWVTPWLELLSLLTQTRCTRDATHIVSHRSLGSLKSSGPWGANSFVHKMSLTSLRRILKILWAMLDVVICDEFIHICWSSSSSSLLIRSSLVDKQIGVITKHVNWWMHRSVNIWRALNQWAHWSVFFHAGAPLRALCSSTSSHFVACTLVWLCGVKSATCDGLDPALKAISHQFPPFPSASSTTCRFFAFALGRSLKYIFWSEASWNLKTFGSSLCLTREILAGRSPTACS